tara:strand:+ start:1741 stop:2019 length:279 start_codon:yes stop_codon:yes gene_type:complete
MKENLNQAVEIVTNAKLGLFAGVLAITSEWWTNFGEEFFSMATVILGAVLLFFMVVGHFYKILETRARTKKLNSDMDKEERAEQQLLDESDK